MNHRKFLILIVPGLTLLLLSLSKATTLTKISAAQASVQSEPLITVTKTANPDTLEEPGGEATYTISISNAGSNNVVLVSLTDDKFGDLRDSANGGVTDNTCLDVIGISSGDPVSCSFKAQVTGQPGNDHTNTVTAQVKEDGSELQVNDDGSATITIQDVPSSIVTTLAVVPTNVPEPGGNVTFTVHVENTSAVDEVTIDTLTGSTPLDNLNGKGTCAVPQPLTAGASYQCSVTTMISGTPGQEKNFTVIAAGTDDDGIEVAGSSNGVKITIQDVPSSIVTTLTAAPTSVPAPGGNVAFTVRVENTSAVDTVTINTLTGSPLLSNLNGKGNCSVPRTLVVGASYQCSVTAMVQGVPEETKNFSVIATGKDDDDVEVAGASSPVQITIADPPPTQLFLPLALSSFFPNDPDEPNNACAQAHGIVINADYSFLPDDKEDWYRFNLVGLGNLNVELNNFVPVQGQIILYKGSCGSLQFLQNNGNFSSTKTINRAETAGTFYVRIITDGPFSTTPYRLRVGFP